MELTPVNKALVAALQANQPVALWSEPGTGKTSLARAIAEKAGWLFVSVDLASIEAQDLIGLPVVNKDRSVRFAPPQWAQKLSEEVLGEEGAILLLDELGSCHPSVAVAAMSICLERIVGDTQLGPNARIMLAGNPPESAAGAAIEIAAPVSNRLCQLDFKGLEIDDWTAGLIGGFKNVTPEIELAEVTEEGQRMARMQVAAFLKHRPDMLQSCPDTEAEQSKPWPSRRSWENVTKILPFIDTLEAKTKAVAGLVGEEAAMIFMTWEKYGDLVDPQDILFGDAELPWDAESSVVFSNIIGLLAYLKSLDVEMIEKCKVRFFQSIINTTHRDLTELVFMPAITHMSSVGVASETEKLDAFREYNKHTSELQDAIDAHTAKNEK